ncbi:DNA repair protein RecN [Caproiciproducens galactitolivorans]|uniref:DNA repair protein RecN n=1 Tax=Caproiciproducens galactitolivorans TaxID=642589 RepID=A0A4Z0YC17_9FIRM|nr:DNA repair protein RecN [Caproiciproducens galactitolivorans]QEY34085.1 DNA repair protein RecN [Caproiciproducens galactitolivorans]TGJ76500.1 DNA repair protein RecN [Caproiciproducens galactitolivorans]
MLSQLYIENIAVIEKTGIDFHEGLNVLTGETGAGKSIVIDSINAILGVRTSRELIRTGAHSANVTAIFLNIGEQAVRQMNELGYAPEEDGSVMIQRELHMDGKAVCRINSRPATVSVLKAIGPFLINIHGQHESYDLLSPDLHIHYIDRMGVPEDLIQSYQDAFEAMNEIKKKLDSTQMDEAQKARQIDLLAYQIQELEAADLRAGEQEELNQTRTRYLNMEKIVDSVNTAKVALHGDENSEGALAAVSAAAGALAEAERYYPELHELTERITNIQYELEDCGDEIRNLTDGLEYDPGELDRIETRLDVLYRLGLKYGSTVEEMLAFLENSKKQMEDIQLSDERTAQLTKKYNERKAQAEKYAEEISACRKKTADAFVMKVKKELCFLDMPNIDFKVEQERCELNSLGCDKLQFLISTNPGEPAKPIAKIASGGELSRIMLAIKTVLADKDDIDTLIFDEVDTGVSGSAAQKVGLKLREVSRNRQVICVTHLPQIAALANTQYLIKKHVKDNKTFTNVTELDFEGRKQELARIMGGSQITPLLLQNAEEMLEMAQKQE